MSNAWRHTKLDAEIEQQQPAAIALGLIRELNGDNNNNYPFTKRQQELLGERIQIYQAKGVVFDKQLISNIAYDAEALEDGFEDLAEILNDIFESMDENGEELASPDMGYHFDAYPFPVK